MVENMKYCVIFMFNTNIPFENISLPAQFDEMLNPYCIFKAELLILSKLFALLLFF